MRKMTVSLPFISMIAVTRGMFGAGLSLLLADQLSSRQRKFTGWTLFLTGAASTVPLAAGLLKQARKEKAGEEENDMPQFI